MLYLEVSSIKSFKPWSKVLIERFLTILIALLVGVAGFYIWREIQWPWMFVGTVVMLFGNALPTKFFGSLVGSAVDFVFILALVTTHIVLS
ncbi:hypothetical protein NSTCB13_05286 [Nostoc sp. DSM 114160]